MFPRQTIQVHSNPSFSPTTDAEEAEGDQFCEDLQHLELRPKKDVLFIIWDWNTKIGSQEIPRIMSKFLRGSTGKEFTCNVGDLGLIPGLGRSPEEGKGYPIHYYDLENSMECIVHGVAKSWA